MTPLIFIKITLEDTRNEIVINLAHLVCVNRSNRVFVMAHIPVGGEKLVMTAESLEELYDRGYLPR